MDIGSLLLIVSILILTILFVIRPFFKSYEPGEAGNDPDQDSFGSSHQLSALLAEKERLLGALQELEADHDLGKIPEEDFSGQRAELMAAGAKVLKDLDEMDELLGIPSEENSDENSVSFVHDEMPPPLNTMPDPIEELVNARRLMREEKSAGFCPKCGKVIQKSDVFCPRCGIKVSG